MTSSSTAGNSNYKEAAPTAERLANKGIGFVDAGTSGGVWGLTEGYCLMVGGTKESVAVVEPAFLTLAPEGGYAHVGPVGAGHFVKMVHNGIEYGLMQAYAEGFEIMQSAERVLPRPARDRLDLALRLGGAQLAARADRTGHPARGRTSRRSPRSSSTRARVAGPSLEAIDRAVPAPVITAALFNRFSSRDKDSYANKLVAAMRNQFGGHAVTLESGKQGMETKTPVGE